MLAEIRYPIVGEPGFVTVATTRPETMLGDVAVAVNPDDERYAHLHGKMLRLPLTGREIPIVTDSWVSRDFGTGAVKVTPAHDPNDFALGQRHSLPSISVMDETAHMNAAAGSYAGLDRYKARQRVLADLEAQDLLAGVRDHVNSIGKCDRCKTVVEPLLSTQWFIRIQPLADPAIAAVEQGYIRFTPEQYSKTYFEWMRNIHDWCISRQLWWGHRIPAWHCAECGKITVSRTTPEVCAHCGSARIEQEKDVLDTWFSSGLLPCSSLGWPEHTPDLDAFYPTRLLVTGFDILFFWVARMIMLGCHFMLEEPLADGSKRTLKDAVPFRDVHIHALVRDADRQKMSKTKGNVLDPIQVVEKFGTDAVRFTLAAMASPGTDIAFSEERTDGYRAFANKIWNAARFIFMQMERAAEAGIVCDLSQLTGDGDTLWRRAMDCFPPASHCGRDEPGVGGVSLSRGSQHHLSLFLGRFLRLVPGSGQAAFARSCGAGHAADGVRIGPAAAVSVHAVYHRGDLARALRESSARQIDRAQPLSPGAGRSAGR